MAARREVFFETNGVPRMVEVDDRRQSAASGAVTNKRAARERADPTVLGSVASPMSGEIIEVVAKPGATVGVRAPEAGPKPARKVACCHRVHLDFTGL